jgi:threonine/homoserine/homoserine lactone efflux protein
MPDGLQSWETDRNFEKEEGQMDLNCPNCSSPDTQKLSLVMSKGGLMEKGAKFGVAYAANIWIPLATVIFAIMFGIVFAMMNTILGILVFCGVLYAGYAGRKWLKAKTKSKFADVAPAMKQSGFQCNRCEHLFIPAV